MEKRFSFADAFWFRVPLKALVLSVSVFAFLSLYPALTSGSAGDHERALFGLTVLAGFIVAATVFTVAINDSHVVIDADHLHVRFEAFFNARIPLRDIVGVRVVDPRPRWRYRFGLATNFTDRISCSHGGSFVEIELARSQMTRLWPRVLPVTRFWIAVREHDEFLATLRQIASRPGDTALPPPLSAAPAPDIMDAKVHLCPAAASHALSLASQRSHSVRRSPRCCWSRSSLFSRASSTSTSAMSLRAP